METKRLILSFFVYFSSQIFIFIWRRIHLWQDIIDRRVLYNKVYYICKYRICIILGLFYEKKYFVFASDIIRAYSGRFFSGICIGFKWDMAIRYGQ